MFLAGTIANEANKAGDLCEDSPRLSSPTSPDILSIASSAALRLAITPKAVRIGPLYSVHHSDEEDNQRDAGGVANRANRHAQRRHDVDAQRKHRRAANAAQDCGPGHGVVSRLARSAERASPAKVPKPAPESEVYREMTAACRRHSSSSPGSLLALPPGMT